MALITVSRGSMSGGEALARLLGERLGCQVIRREVLVEAAADLGVSEETLAQKLARSPGTWERLTSNRRVYLTALQAALAEHVIEGFVYHGHAGHLLLGRVPGILNVRLIAPIEARVKAVMARQGLGREAALAYIQEVDEERVRWTQLIYGVDWRDPSLYDLVINLDEISLETAAAAVAGIARAPEYAMTDALRARLVDFRLECRVKLALVRNAVTRDMRIEVSAQDGVVTLEGALPPSGLIGAIEQRDEQSVLGTVRAVEGVRDLRWKR